MGPTLENDLRTSSTAITWAGRMDFFMYHLPRSSPVEIQEMGFVDYVRHDLDPHDAHESLLYVRSNISVYCTAPWGSGKEQRQ